MKYRYMPIPQPGEHWLCRKCGNNGTNYRVQHNASSQLMTLQCNRCGYFEWRAPHDWLPDQEREECD